MAQACRIIASRIAGQAVPSTLEGFPRLSRDHYVEARIYQCFFSWLPISQILLRVI
jgi:hypothetical protein